MRKSYCEFPQEKKSSGSALSVTIYSPRIVTAPKNCLKRKVRGSGFPWNCTKQLRESVRLENYSEDNKIAVLKILDALKLSWMYLLIPVV